MDRYPRHRRALSIALIVLGAILIFFAPDQFWLGAVLALVGFVIELIAFWLAYRDERKN
jgi:hypothetical protein